MTLVIGKRLLSTLGTLFGSTIVVFFLLHLTGDPTQRLLPESATETQREAFRHAMGFDRPVIVQYGDFLWKMLHGDFGVSLLSGLPALDVVLSRMPATIQLVIPAIILTVTTSMCLAFYVAVRDSAASRALLRFVTVAGQGLPGFVLGVLLIYAFSVAIPIFPSSGRGDARSVVLPSIVLAAFAVPQMTWVLWSSLRQVLRSDYIRTARSMGLGWQEIYLRRALRNALGPFITLVGVQLGVLLAGSVVTEVVFAWPGMGQLMVQSITGRDYPVVQVAVALVVLVFVVVNSLVDAAYPLIDPRLRSGS